MASKPLNWLGALVKLSKDDELKRWRVISKQEMTDTLTLEAWDGSRIEIVNQDPDYEVIAFPSKDWPFVSCRARANDPIVAVEIPGRKMKPIPLHDWAPTSRLSSAGALYLAPWLNLKWGNTIQIIRRSGHRENIVIKKNFSSYNQRVAKKKRDEEKKKRDEEKKNFNPWDLLGGMLPDDD